MAGTLAADDEGVRGLQPAARAQAAAHGPLSVVLPDDDAADSVRARPGWDLYLAKRITRPVQMLAAAAKEIGAGRLDHRVEPETQRRVRLAGRGLQHDGRASWPRASASSIAARFSSSGRTCEVEERRRYIETILERIATGVVSLDADGRVDTINAAASRLLGARRDRSSASRPAAVFERDDLQPLRPLLASARPRARRAGRAGDRAGARGPGAAARGGRHGAGRAMAASRKAPCSCSTT